MGKTTSETRFSIRAYAAKVAAAAPPLTPEVAARVAVVLQRAEVAPPAPAEAASARTSARDAAA